MFRVIALARLGEAVATPVGIFCLTAASLGPATPNPDIPDLLRRIEALLARGGDVLLFRERELYAMTGLVNRYTKAPLRFVAGLSLLIRAFVDPYGNLEGRRLEALARLFGQNARVYAYPMAARDLQEWIDRIPPTGRVRRRIRTATRWGEFGGLDSDLCRRPTVSEFTGVCQCANKTVSLRGSSLTRPAVSRVFSSCFLPL